MKTTHQYIFKYPISAKSEKLILGTIHPNNHKDFILPFYYGNVMSIWNILNSAFPCILGNPITLEKIIDFLDKNKISISDTIIECERKNPTALDEDLIPLELNYDLIEQIKKSSINEILCTSGFGQNNAFKLFYVDILEEKITTKIRQTREVIIDKKHFGRPIKLSALYSPSGTSNTGLSKSKIYLSNKHLYNNSRTPVYDFKVNYYREKFS
ncbi:MAG: hypothetical protein IPK10_15820 [Bacteroidetes bacterium]|nr:hypothetical protein [Bacteroidota bacterium]